MIAAFSLLTLAVVSASGPEGGALEVALQNLMDGLAEESGYALQLG
jgi:hypothetical protein